MKKGSNIASRSGTSLKDASVLLVDDTATILDMYERLLQHEGYRVRTAATGQAALNALETMTPDLIILDHMMPEMSGLEVLEQIRRNPRTQDTPVVFLTATGDDESIIERAFSLGASDYLQKPLNRQIFASRIASVILQHRQRQAVSAAAELQDEHERVRDELSRARTLQHRHLPATPAVKDGWRVLAALCSCDEVGGDQYDIIDDRHGRRTLVLVDVSGHGLASAMVGAGIRSMLRVLLQTHTLEVVLEELNMELCAGRDEHYACVALIQFDFKVVRVINAGLPPIILLGHAGRRVVEGGGVPPGLLPKQRYTELCVPADEVHTVIALTDGLTEPFGAADEIGHCLAAFSLADGAGETEPDDLGARITALFDAHAIEQPDDATVIVAKRIAGADTSSDATRSQSP